MISINVKAKTDKRAQELGFEDRFEMRAAIRKIAYSMSTDEWDNLPAEELTSMLIEAAKSK